MTTAGGSASLPNGVVDVKPAATAAGSTEDSRQASGPVDRSQNLGSSTGGSEHESQPQRQGSGRQGPDMPSRREDRGDSQGGVHDDRGSSQGGYRDDRGNSQGGRDDRGYSQSGREERGYSQSGREDRRDGNRRGDRRDRNGKEGRRDRGGGFTGGNRADEEDSWRRSGPPPAGRRSRGRDQVSPSEALVNCGILTSTDSTEAISELH